MGLRGKKEFSVLVEHGRWISHLLNDFRVLEQRLEHTERRLKMLEDPHPTNRVQCDKITAHSPI